MSTLPPDELARVRNETIGFVFQGFNLLARTSAVENVELPLLYTRQGVVEADERRERAHGGARCRRADRSRRHHPNQLSGGQQQRVAIARALVSSRRLLLADEPTGNLDTATSHEVMEMFARLRAERGITIVVITHERDIAAYGTRTIDFRDGQVVSDVHPYDCKRWLSHPSFDLRVMKEARPQRCAIPVDIAIKALGRNRLQTGLTMLGITVGVATVLAMMAVGAGAQRRSNSRCVRPASIRSPSAPATGAEDRGQRRSRSRTRATRATRCELPSLRADAGTGLLEDGPLAVSVSPGPKWSTPSVDADAEDDVALCHPEDDPMEKHDHPLGASAAGRSRGGLGSAATMTFADAEAIRTMPGVQYVAGGVQARRPAPPRRISRRRKRWFTRMHGTDVEMPSIKRAWTLTGRPLLHRARTDERGAGAGHRPGRRRQAVRRRHEAASARR